MNPPPYQQFPELKGNIISLKQINDDDIHEIIEISFYDGILASTYDEAKAMLDKINHDYSLGNSVHWAIVANDNNKILGTCGFTIVDLNKARVSWDVYY
jgi:ribosomal-protein-alanine N-acetyltransferase